MIWKRLAAVAGIVVLTSAAGTALAQSTTGQADSEPRIAVINTNRVIEQSTIGQQARSRIEDAMGEWRQRLTEKQSEIEALDEQRQEGALTLSDQALQDLQTQIENVGVELQRLQDDARREMNRLRQQVMADMNEKLSPLLEQLAVQGGYDLILDAANVPGMLYYANRIDATESFLALVNENNPSLGGSGQDQEGQGAGSRP